MIPLMDAVAAKGTLTPKVDTQPVVVKVGRPRGTVYWGGAGLNGPYIADQVAAFQQMGIKYVWIGKRTNGDLPDALRAATGLRMDTATNEQQWMIEGLEKVPADQFNLIGYSYGSLMAAHTAKAYADYNHIVDHLVLLASPINKEFLEHLQSQRNIRKIIIINLTHHGDPIYAGMPFWKLWLAASTLNKQNENSGKTGGIGHFYYRADSQEGSERRRRLALYLYQQGLR